MALKIEVVRVLRGCKAYKEGEILSFSSGKVHSKNNNGVGCLSAEVTVHTNIGRIQFHHPLYLSCLDAGITAEGCGNVIFKIYREDE